MAGQTDRKTRRCASVNKENEKSKENFCGKCKKGFTTPGERVMNCDMCAHWYHGKCTTLSDNLIKEIDSVNSIKWFCQSCENSATGVLTELLKIQKRQDDTEEALNTLIERYDNHIDDCSELITKTIDETLQTQIEDKISTSIQTAINENIDEENIKEKVVETVKKVIDEKVKEIDVESKIKEKLESLAPEKPTEFPCLKSSFAELLKEPGEAKSNLYQVVREEVSEQKQIEALKMNLVITGIPEKPNPETEIQEVISLFEHELNITPDISKTERIGKPREKEPRLLRITFTTMRSRREVLVNAINLRNSINKDVKEKIFVRPDMTESQRKDSKNLRELLKKMKKDNPTKNYIIRRNQVIEKPSSSAVPPQQ